MSRLVSPPVTEQVHTIQSVEPANGGCVYNVAVEVDVPKGQRLLEGFEAAWRTDVHEHIARNRQVLATAREQPAARRGDAIDGPALGPPPQPPMQET